MERFCFVFILAFLLSPAVGHSQTRILVACRCENGSEKLSRLVERSAVLSLERSGFKVVGADSASDEASWTLLADLSYRNGNYRLELSFLSPEKLRLASSLLSGQISLDFDVQLMAAVERMIRESGADLARANPPGEGSGVLPPMSPLEPELPALAPDRQEVADLLAVIMAEAPHLSSDDRSGPMALPVPSAEALASRALTPASAGTPTPETAPQEAPQEAPAMVSDNAPQAVARPAEPAVLPSLSLPGEGASAAVVLPGGARPMGPLVIDADSGPVFVVGKASDSFRYGFDVSCRVGAAFGLGILRIDAALRTGYARLTPTGLVGGALHLITLGPEIGLVLPESSPLRFRCRVGCGPLYVAAEAAGSEVVGKILPFGQAGIGLDFLPGPRFSIGLELEMMAIFERNEPLIALVPVFGVGLRF